MADGKNSIIVYRDWKNIFDELSNEEAGILIKYFFSYVNDEHPNLNDKYLKMAFLPIKLALKRDLKHWESVKIRRSESGRLGGINSGESRRKKQANEANASNLKQNEANEAVSVSVSVSDNVLNNPPNPPSGGKCVSTDLKSWKADYDIYLTDLRKAFRAIKKDSEWIEQQEKFNPGIDVILSVEKACANYWATEGGWKKKRRAKIIDIDWRSTFANAIPLNRVFKPKESINETHQNHTYDL